MAQKHQPDSKSLGPNRKRQRLKSWKRRHQRAGIPHRIEDDRRIRTDITYYVCMHVCMYVCIYIYISIYVFLKLYLHILYIYTYIYICIHSLALSTCDLSMGCPCHCQDCLNSTCQTDVEQAANIVSKTYTYQERYIICLYTYTYTYTYTNTYAYTYTYTYHTCIHTYIHSYIHPSIHTYICIRNIYIYIYAHTLCIYIYRLTHIYIYNIYIYKYIINK